MPRMLRNAPLPRRVALLSRGPWQAWVPALRFTAKGRCTASGTRSSFPIDICRIELPIRIHERQLRTAIGGGDLAVEAGTPARVARGAHLLDPDPDRVLVAVHAHLDHALGLT